MRTLMAGTTLIAAAIIPAARRTHETVPAVIRAALFAVVGLLQVAPAAAKSFQTLATLPPVPVQHAYPNLSGLAADAQGRLYGASTEGGAFAYGYIYRLTPSASKSDPWTFETLHDFNTSDGASPVGSLTIGSGGEVYGTTNSGGAYTGGTAFRLDPAPGWPLTTLHAFGAKDDPGAGPRGSLVFGPDGLLYGTTFYSFRNKNGSAGDVFSLSPSGDSVSYAVIHNFSTTPGANGGYEPNGDLVAAPNGDLYGTTMQGGLASIHGGVFFKLSRNVAGIWRYTDLHDFLADQGDYFPMSPVRASDGAYYGCSVNASVLQGSVYELTPPSQGVQGWTEATVAVFPPRDGGRANTACETVAVNPTGGLIVTNMTFDFSAGPPKGRVLQLLPPASAGSPWTTRTLHVFDPTGTEPYYPMSSLLRQGGLYYGVTIPAIPVDGGTVYDVRP